jgi:putative flippase GtrA
MRLQVVEPRLRVPGLGRLWIRRHQLLRYAGVSVISTATSLSVLGGLVGLVGLGAGLANLAATAAGTIPSYELNRRWVWSRRDKRSLGREVLPFCALSFAGLLLSTIAVTVAAAVTVRSDRLVHTAAVQLASVFAYGSLWVLQFVVLDRLLFGARSGQPGARSCEPPGFLEPGPGARDPGGR